jgi:thioredoxin-like negative regulator of GroEL
LARRADYFITVPEAPETLGWILLLRQEHEPAVEALTRAVRRRPDATRARYRLGRALAANGDEESAREAFLEVMKTDAPEAEQARIEIARLAGAE